MPSVCSTCLGMCSNATTVVAVIEEDADEPPSLKTELVSLSL